MSPDTLTNNDQEYIEGLLHHTPEVIEHIYQRFATKAGRFIQQKGGNVKDAAHIFEEALMDIYYFAKRHPLKVNTFENFLLLLCKRIWERELERRGQRIPGLEADETATLSRDDLQDVEDVLKEGEKRRLAYHHYLQLGDDCKGLIRWSLTDYLQEDIAVATKIPIAELPARRASCFHELFKRIDSNLSPMESFSESSIQEADAFLSGFLSEANRKAYSARLQSDPALTTQIRRFDLIRKLLAQRICTDNNRDELQHLLFGHRNAWFSVRDSTNMPIRKFVVLTAIIAAGLATLLYISPWHKNIYSQFASTEIQSIENDSMRLSDEITREFNRGHFSDALQLLNKVLADQPNNTYARYYRGVCLVDLNQLDPARKDLLTVFNSNNDLRYEAAFYMGLSYLKEGRKQDCLEWLLKIPEGAPNYLKVQKLIDELKA
ncbi:tetratricopeptide repeat protein [Chitinophaga vietnamensis]|uniref:tetratricopeptide repeat protein n=1 Tax=Chitinophaga vietnamensis TaxID=2593957 RepID=UPI00117787BE|nr:tetratricopeptide repeat protein [Chitinophaga vietnamensis]